MRKIVFIVFGISVCFLVVFVLLSGFSSQRNQAPASSPTPTAVPNPPRRVSSFDFSHIFSDSTVAKQMSEKLQNPQQVITLGDQTVYSFDLTYKVPVVQVYTRGNGVSFVVEQATEENSYYSDFQSSHQNEKQVVLHDPQFFDTGYDWQVFPEDGVAFLANTDSGFTLKTIYFEPTTQDGFVKNVAKTLSITTSVPTEAPEKFE